MSMSLLKGSMWLLSFLLLTTPSFAAWDYDIDYVMERMDYECDNIGRRAGCSGCEADPNCSWCIRESEFYAGICTVAEPNKKRGTSCLELRGIPPFYDDIQLGGRLCPVDPRASRPWSIPSGGPFEGQERLSQTNSFDPKYCSIPEGHTVDYCTTELRTSRFYSLIR